MIVRAKVTMRAQSATILHTVLTA